MNNFYKGKDLRINELKRLELFTLPCGCVIEDTNGNSIDSAASCMIMPSPSYINIINSFHYNDYDQIKIPGRTSLLDVSFAVNNRTIKLLNTRDLSKITHMNHSKIQPFIREVPVFFLTICFILGTI